MACPWYVAVAVSDPAFAHDFFWTHNVLRYVAPLDHEKPFWFYLPDLLLGMLPWTLLLYSLLKSLARRPAAAAERRPPGLGLFLLTCMWCLLFYSAAGCKRAGYILPAMPPLALALGWYLDAALADAAWRRIGVAALGQQVQLARGALVLVLALAVGGSILAACLGMQTWGSAAAVATTAAAGLWCLRRHSPGLVGSWILCGAVTFAVLLVAVHQVLPGYTRKFSLRKQVRPQVPVSANPQLPVVCYPHGWDSVSFYLRRNDVRVYTPAQRHDLMALLRAQPDTLVFVKSDDAVSRHLTDFLSGLPASLEFVPRGRGGIVTAGLVRRRAEATAAGLAAR
jgi:4-amino-4-deoxy-L-arabinose transferase-like glycosyltransferase